MTRRIGAIAEHVRPTAGPAPAVMRLILLGTLLEGLYLAAFVVPFPLLGHGEPAQDLGTLTGGTPASAVGLLVAIACLCLVSWRAYGCALAAAPRTAARTAFGFAVLFAVTMLWMYPIDALDLFDYAMRGRILGVFGDNPYLYVPAQYPADPFLPSVGWKLFPSVYGPIWLYLEAFIGRATGDNQVAALIGLKVVAALSSLVCTWSIYTFVRRHRPTAAPGAMVLFAWNPLVVLMVGSGHNDAFMMVFVLGGLALADSGRRGLGLWVMGLSVAVKLAVLPVLPALMLGQLTRTGRRRAIRTATVVGIALAATLVAVHAPLWPGWSHFGPVVRMREDLFTLSPPGFLHELAVQSGADPTIAGLVSPLTYVLIGVLALQAMWRTRRGTVPAVHAAYDALFWIVFVALAWWQPWYLVWLAGLAALDDRPWVARLSWVAACAGLVSLFDRFYLTERWLAVPWWEHHVHSLVLVYLPPVVAALVGLVSGQRWAQSLRDRARSTPPAASGTRPGAVRKWRRAYAVSAIALLLIACSASVADGLFQGIVAYERDTTVFYYPLATWVADQLHQTSQLPLWTPTLFGGYPIFADGELGLGSPIVSLALRALPIDIAFVWLRVVHLCIAAIGCYALARAWRLPHLPAALAGLTFALGSFFPSQIHHENIVRTAAWLPAILALIERALRSTGRGRWRWMLGGSACVGFAALGLHAQILLIDIFTLVAYAMLRSGLGPIHGTVGSGKRRALAIASLVAPIVVLGLSLAAVQLVPFAELVGFSSRGQGIPYVQAASYSLTPPGLVQLVFPFFFRGGGNLQWGLWTHWESYLYVGLTPLVMALVGVICVRRRELWIWVVLGSIGLLLSLGQYSPINLDYLLWLTPELSGLRAPGRWSLVVVLALAMLAGYGLTWLERQARSQKPLRLHRGERLPIMLLIAPVALTVALWLAHDALLGNPQGAQELIDTMYLAVPHDSYPLQAADVFQGLLWSTTVSNPDVLRALGGLIALAVALAVWQFGPFPSIRRWRGWSSLLVMATIADLLSFGWNIHPREPLATLSAPQPSALAVQKLLGASTTGPYRVLTSPVMNEIAPNRLAPLGLEEASGYSSLEMPRQADLLKRVFSVDDGLLDMWNIRYLLEPAQYGSVADYGGVDYLPGQALLNAAAGGTLGEATFSVPPAFRVQQIRILSAAVNAVDMSQDAPVAEITLSGTSGESPRTMLLRGGQAMSFDIGDGRTLSYWSIDVDPARGADTLRIRSVVRSGELIIYGAAIVDPTGTTSQLFGHHKTKFHEVYRDTHIAVLENSSAYPRVFFVPGARVAPPGQTSLNVMLTQPFSPSTEVALPADTQVTALQPALRPAGSSELQTSLQAPGSQSEHASIEGYAPDAVVVRVTAARDAFLVLSDTFYPGWQAFVDGQSQTLLRGDMLFRVVAVPAGQHVVTFRFQPASVANGAAITLLAELLLIGCACWLLLREG